MESKENIEPIGDNRFRRDPTTTIKEVTVEVKPPEKLSAAEKMYSKHIYYVKKYQQNNPEKMKAKSKRYMDKLKKDTKKYAEYLEKRRNYYHDVLRPKKMKKIEAAHEELPTTLVI